ncbi:hypothetical protein CLF_110993 [Clonorchis sinensis]|uniref:Uncharacterized protein n=1 Tax=Clonorchis sinensis TaxID=79923 RepID=G7YLC2_CLOSI|nr:hypothetical protein CLF_110993 [Clonorchis sinensis]
MAEENDNDDNALHCRLYYLLSSCRSTTDKLVCRIHGDNQREIVPRLFDNLSIRGVKADDDNPGIPMIHDIRNECKENLCTPSKSSPECKQRKHPATGNVTTEITSAQIPTSASNARLHTSPPQIIGGRNCGSYNHCATSTRFLQLMMMAFTGIWVSADDLLLHASDGRQSRGSSSCKVYALDTRSCIRQGSTG